jgi:lysophospholipase L1-like esterase
MLMTHRSLAISFTMLALIPPASGQLVDDFQPPRANCCLQSAAQSLADQLQDWNQLGRYHADNQRLMALPPDPQRVVFLGDSITDGWKLAESFPGKPYVNRGISGQTTSQMLVRMFPDVISLKPATLVVLAGTNDISRNTGPVTLEMIGQNIQAITELAQLHGIKVVLCSLLPISDYTARKQSERRPPANILQLNAWIKAYAAKANAVYADYFSVSVDEKGMLKDGTSNDGLHPNAKGYQLMIPVVQAAIEQSRR